MHKPSNRTLLIISLLFAVLATGISIRYIDKQVAALIWAFTSSQPFLHKHIAHIPNTLPKVVVMGTAILWLAYYCMVRKKGASKPAQFLLLAATVIPVAYLIKIFLHFAFGRTGIRMWLLAGKPLEFRWFNPLDACGFPSGHTVVFTAFFTAVWLYFPRMRPLVIAALSALALALMLTSYHFVSDIIAGLCCGILITLSIHHVIPILNRR